MGVEDGEADGTTVVPTEPGVVGATVGAAVVALVYTGAVVGATTLEVVTGLMMVQGQLVMVKVVDSVAV